MLKIFVYINTAFLVIAVGGGVFAFFNRGKITESIMTEVQKQLPSLVKGAMPSIPKTPSATGGVLPF